MTALVTIGCLAYNQKDYIRQTLDSFVNQKTNFPFEVIINDDCSTDGTTEIIKEYEQKYPDIIKPIYQKENLYSQGINITRNAIAPLINSKYFILCDGDDYFCDDTKLQQQVDFLEAHPEFVGCYHPVKIIYEDEPNKVTYNATKSFTVTFEKELKANYIPTNSVMYRWRFVDENVLEYYPEGIMPGDWYWHLLHLQKGDVYHFSDEALSVYRINKGGIWGPIQHDPDLINVRHGLRYIKFYHNVYKNLTNESEEYKKSMFLPNLISIVNSNLKYKKWKELAEIYDTYDSFLSEVPTPLIGEPDKVEKFTKKYKKYKKYFNRLLVVSISTVVILMILLVLSLYLH